MCSNFVCSAARQLPGPLAQTRLDITKSPVPIHRGTARSGVRVVDPLLVTQGNEGFDVAVVPEPAARNDMVVKMREPNHELFDPGPQCLPLLMGFVGRVVRPVHGSVNLVGTIGPSAS